MEEDYKRAATGKPFENWDAPTNGAVEFVKTFASGTCLSCRFRTINLRRIAGSEDPVILFSHIPLHRPDTASCGPHRERGTIRRGAGFGYQNTLGRLTTEYLLKSLRPNLIFRSVPNSTHIIISG